MMEFGTYRAAFAKAGVDPRAIDTMSLYEIVSMNIALRKMDRPNDKTMSDQEFDDLISRVRAMNMPDVKI